MSDINTTYNGVIGFLGGIGEMDWQIIKNTSEVVKHQRGGKTKNKME